MKTIYLIFMSLSVFILTSVLLIKQNTNLVFGNESDFHTASVTIDKARTPTEISSLLETIQNLAPSEIVKVTFISPQEQLQDVQAALPTYSRGLFENEEISQILNPIVEVQFSPTARSQDLIEKIKTFPGVYEISFGNAWIEKIKNIFDTLNIILNTVFILFFIILSFLIAVLIRNYLVNTKENISLLSLLGATPRQSFWAPYLSITTYTLLAYALGTGLSFTLSALIKYKLSSNVQLAFFCERLSLLSSYNVFLIFTGLTLNLGISYLLSYQYVLKEYYQND